MVRRSLGIVLGLALAAQIAAAQTSVTFNRAFGATGPNAGVLVFGNPNYVDPVGPYSGRIGGGPLINWYCTDFANSVSQNNTFNAYLTGLTASTFVAGQTRYGLSFGNATAALQAYQQASFLSLMFNQTYNASGNFNEWDDIHSAIWSIFNPNTTPQVAPSSLGSGTAYWLSFAQTHYSGYDYSNVFVITDVCAASGAQYRPTSCGTNTGKQEFMYGNPTVVPEPVSMTLLGTGLAGVFAAGRRRRKQNRA